MTEVALAAVTDEFVAHIRASQASAGEEWDLEQASEFLLVAATLLDLKAARLLPTGEVEDDEDLALLEAKDLLFARLLQYRAYKDVSAVLGERLASEGTRVPRSVPLEPQLATLLPELVMSVTPEQLARLAASALQPRKAPEGVGTTHLHGSSVSVREEADHVARRLRRSGTATFRDLVADADSTLVVVARFLALLELYRDGAVAFEQADALAELTVRWARAPAGEDPAGHEGEVGAAEGSTTDDLPAADEYEGHAP